MDGPTGGWTTWRTADIACRADGWQTDGRAGWRTEDKEHIRRLLTSTACREEKAVVFAAAYSWQDQAGSTEIASAPGMLDCRRDDPTFRIRYRCLCKQKFVTRQFPTIYFVNHQRAWYGAYYLHCFSRLQLEFNGIDINFFPTKNYIIISSKKMMQQTKKSLDNTSGQKN